MELIPSLATPADWWRQAIRLGQQCVDGGVTVPTMHLVIAALCLSHEVPITTFDSHFVAIAQVVSLKVNLLERAG